MKSKSTLATPTVPLSFPFPFASSANPKLYSPNRFANIVQVRANVSSECVVTISSQSFERVVEKDMEVIGGNFRAVSGIDSEVDFLRREPRVTQFLVLPYVKPNALP